MKSAKRDCDLLRAQYQEEQEAKAELLRALCKGDAEMVKWRIKCEDDTIQSTEDLEDAEWVVQGCTEDSENGDFVFEATCVH